MFLKRKLLCFALFALPVTVFSQSAGIWDVYAFGAKGDGKTNDTYAIQKAIDSCYNSGGGKILLHNGHFLSGTILLKSNVTLFIEAGAVLLGSNNPGDYLDLITDYPVASGEFSQDKSLVYAEDAENIAIIGNGIIDGGGNVLEPMQRPRPHCIVIRRCKSIKIRDLKIRNAAFWVQKYQSCDNLLIEGITVDSRENRDIEKPRFMDVPGGRNTDGCDIVDCKNVRISNCNINSGDDGIVFKSFLRNEGCQNITVSNCLITTNASGIKIGTETAGFFRDFTITNCVIYDTRGAAIGLMSVDGGIIERIIVSNITLRNIKGTAIFLRLGNRGKIYQKGYDKAGIGKLSDILIQNIYGTEIERYGCSITGIAGGKPENIVLENINLKFKKGSDPLLFEGYPDRVVEEVPVDSVPESERSYPRGEMFGKLPAYGFFVRHVGDIEFNGVKLESNEYDKRPAIVAEDVDSFAMDSFSANVSSAALALICFRNVQKISVNKTSSISPVPLFIKLPGNDTRNVNSKK